MNSDGEAKTNAHFDNPEHSIPERFEMVAALHPHRIAVLSSQWQPTYEELNAAANRLAHVFIPRGSPGDRVALLMRQDTPSIAAILAVLKAGRIAVVLNSSDPPARLAQIWGEAEPRVLVTDFANRDLAAQIAGTDRDIVCFEQYSTGPAEDPGIKVAPGAVAFIIFTSGSTGRPKGVMQTHRNIIHNALRLSRGMRLQKEDRITLLASPSGGQGLATMWCALFNGATLCPFAIMERTLPDLADWVVERGITVLILSASVFRRFMQSLDEGKSFPAVRLIRMVSEPANADDFRLYQRHFAANCVLFNSLSSSETGNITQHRLTQKDHFTEGRLPVGWPPDGVEIMLLNEHGREVGDGETGEIAIRGRHLSPGYWRNEKLTRERFSGDDNADGVRIFQSGDLGRRAADGSLIFMDRKDSRVKIRGYRVELSEIEGVLLQQPEVEEAIVTTLKTPGGETRIIAHVVPRAGQTCTAETSRWALHKVLPGYMVPANFIFHEQFPLTPHGKIDRERLKQIEPAFLAYPTAEEPATNTEVLLAGIWKKAFDRDSIGRQDDFFDLGGDSLHAVVVAAEVQAALQVELDLRSFADYPTLAKLSQAIDGLPRTNGNKNSAALVRVPRDAPLPLSFTQERNLKYSQTAEGALGYTMTACHRFRGPLNTGILSETMSHLVRRHESLRTTIDQAGGRHVQIVHPAEPVDLPLLDYTQFPDAEVRAARLLRDEARRGFDLKQGPLLRFILVKIREDEHWLLRVSHHIICDDWSWKIYFREMALVYEAKWRGAAVPLPEFEPLQYADYAAMQRNVLRPEGTAYREIMEWWANLFSRNSRPLKLPFRRAWRSRRAKAEDGVIWWGLNPAIADRLIQIGRGENATYYVIRLAAFAALLAAETDQSDVILGTYVTERSRVETQNMFGDFANLATLRLQCDHTQSFREWLSVVRKMVSKIQSHSGIPYEQLCVELKKRGVNPPRIDVIFSVTDLTAPVRFGGLDMTWLEQPVVNMPWGFCLQFDQHNEERRCRLTFDARIYNPTRVRDWINRFIELLEGVSNNPDWSIGKLLALSKNRGKSG